MGAVTSPPTRQVAVSLSVANDHASLPIAYRLYLPPDWAEDKKRRKTAGVPKEVAFATKPAIALGQLRQALHDGVPVGIVLADAAYGVDTDFRAGVSELALSYFAKVRLRLCAVGERRGKVRKGLVWGIFRADD